MMHMPVLPNSHVAVVDELKIRGYLLSFTHPIGRSKAAFFVRFGFGGPNGRGFATRCSLMLERACRKRHMGQNMRQRGRLFPRTGATLRSVRSGSSEREKMRRVWLRPFPALQFEGDTNMIEELDSVVLTRPLPEQGLEVGDVGVVVLVHKGGAAYEVEFLTLDGQTLAVVTLPADAARAVTGREIAHAREVA
jgi:hypothetical protein